MNHAQKGRWTSHVAALLLLVTLNISAAGNDADTPTYRVAAQIFHLGELIANPVMEVEADRTASGSFSVDGSPRYTIAVLVRPAAHGEVSVSLQFSSGAINIQPNILVKSGTDAELVVDKIRMVLRVDELPAAEGI